MNNAPLAISKEAREATLKIAKSIGPMMGEPELTNEILNRQPKQLQIFNETVWPIIQNAINISVESATAALRQELIESHKALDAINHITSGDFLEELEMRDESKMDADLKQCMEALSLIFKIAHSESPNHTCHAVHGGWRTLKSKVLETSKP